MADVLNQSNYLDSQNFDINNFNIDDIYRDFITVIDDIRSKANVTKNVGALNKFDLDNYQTINTIVKPELTAQESRCHAFLRWLGFPVVSEDKVNYYNPGHDIIKDKNRNFTTSVKLSIANSVGDKFKAISLARENYSNRMLNVFSIPESIDAAVVSLLSGANIRKFSDPLQNIDPFDFDEKSQQYKIILNSRVGIHHDINLSSYVDSSGNPPSKKAIDILQQQSHYMKPFIVDPRIDFSVSPSYNKVAVPFVPDNTYLKISEGHKVIRPLIEKIIRERFSATNSSTDMGSSQSATINYTKTLDAIKDEGTLQKVKDMVSNLTFSERNQFTYFLNLARAMMAILVNSQNIIQESQGIYYWLPIPDVTGPEGGVTSHPTFVSKAIYQNNPKLITNQDRAIINSYIKVSLNKFTDQGNSANAEPEVLDFGIKPEFKNSLGSDTSASTGDLAQKNLDKLTTIRTGKLDKACKALQTIEIIMGEYSGLGLSDIIAIMATLYTMPKGDLLGFLDFDSQVRMKTALGFTDDELTILSGNSDPRIEPTLNSFVKNLNNFYSLMDKLYADEARAIGV